MTDATDSTDRVKRERFVYLLSVAWRRVNAALKGDAEGATAARGGLLMAMHPHDGAPMAELGRAVDLGASALSGLIDRMERDGLVIRRPHPADGRALLVAPTDAGRAARDEAIAAGRALNARLIEGFDDAELAVVARWLRTVRERFPKE